MRILSLVAPGAVPAHLRASIAVLNAEESVWVAMLDGWTAQQIARNLAASTVEKRRSIVTRFRAFADCYPWSWSTPVVDEFFLELRALHGASHSTVLGYQNALRMFLEYLTDPAYGWMQQCWDRFGDHPTQLLHEWNSARHSQAAMAEPGKRPYTRDEIQDLFDCADDRVMRIRRAGAKGWVAAFRIATIMKTAYAWGLRRNEVKREAGLDDDLDFHSLRRSYVTHLIEDGYDAFFVQQQVGHEHASTTSIYTGLSPDYRARVVDDAIARMAAQAIAKEN